MHNELYHHGILGQKWGVRRFQNKDGSVTPAGARRYYKHFNETNGIKTSDTGSGPRNTIGTIDNPRFRRESKQLPAATSSPSLAPIQPSTKSEGPKSMVVTSSVGSSMSSTKVSNLGNYTSSISDGRSVVSTSVIASTKTSSLDDYTSSISDGKTVVLRYIGS